MTVAMFKGKRLYHDQSRSTRGVPDGYRIPGCLACKATRGADVAHYQHLAERYNMPSPVDSSQHEQGGK